MKQWDWDDVALLGFEAEPVSHELAAWVLHWPESINVRATANYGVATVRVKAFQREEMLRVEPGTHEQAIAALPGLLQRIDELVELWRANGGEASANGPDGCPWSFAEMSGRNYLTVADVSGAYSRGCTRAAVIEAVIESVARQLCHEPVECARAALSGSKGSK